MLPQPPALAVQLAAQVWAQPGPDLQCLLTSEGVPVECEATARSPGKSYTGAAPVGLGFAQMSSMRNVAAASPQYAFAICLQRYRRGKTSAADPYMGLDGGPTKDMTRAGFVRRWVHLRCGTRSETRPTGLFLTQEVDDFGCPKHQPVCQRCLPRCMMSTASLRNRHLRRVKAWMLRPRNERVALGIEGQRSTVCTGERPLGQPSATSVTTVGLYGKPAVVTSLPSPLSACVWGLPYLNHTNTRWEYPLRSEIS